MIASRYQVEELLGGGGGGQTARCFDLLRECDVTLKIVHHGEEQNTMLRGEFERLRSLHHPRLLEVVDLGELPATGQLFYTAVYLRASTLEDWCRDRQWSEVCGAIVDALDALGYLHAAGLRHGDFAPHNILVDANKRGTLIDLGCSAPLGKAPLNTVAGTPEYIAPELGHGRADHRADLYAVGVTLEKIASWTPVPADVRALAHRLRDRTPDRRPASADAVAATLAPTHPLTRPLSWPRQTVGRVAELQTHADFVATTSNGSPGPRILWLHGPAGCGLSHVLREMKWRSQPKLRVLEGVPRVSRPLGALWRASSTDDNLGLGAALEAARHLAAGPQTLYFMDDVHLLTTAEQRLFLAFARTLPSNSRLGIVCTSRLAPPQDLSCVALPIGPLKTEPVYQWLRALSLPDAVIKRIIECTNGWPGHTLRLALSCAAGQLPVNTDAPTLAAETDLRSLSQCATNALALIVCAGEPIKAVTMHELGVAPATLAELVERHLIKRGALHGALESDITQVELEAVCGSTVTRAAHAAFANRVQSTSRRIHHFAACGEVEAALRLWDTDCESIRATPQNYKLAACALVDLELSLPRLMGVLRTLVACGESDIALRRALAALEAHCDSQRAVSLHAICGEVLAKEGEYHRALPHLQRAWAAERTGAIANHLSLILIKQGNHNEAATIAEAGLAIPGIDDRVRVELLVNCALAQVYAGDAPAARDILRDVSRELQDRVDPTWARQRVRAAGATAFCAQRSGKLAEAIRAHEQCTQLALDAELDHLAVAAAGNAGTAAHQLGDWAAALRSYRHGQRIARATGATSPEVRLRYNLGVLMRDLADPDAARHQLVQAEQGALAHDLPFIAANAAFVIAQIERSSRNFDIASQHLARARQAFAALSATRESLEIDLESARLALAQGDWDGAERRFAMHQVTSQALPADDLSAQALIGRGQALREGTRYTAALACFEEANEIAERLGERPLQAEVTRELAITADALDAPELASEHRKRERALRQRLVTGLSQELRAVYLAHYDDQTTGAASASLDPAVTGSRDWRRLLAINRRLAAAAGVDDLLRETMDTAIELAGAERGFLILTNRTSDGFEVPVARNLDREKISRSHLKFSKSIAERVLETGEPVLTFDAARDDRFVENQSVHAMQLKSVMCVPIRSADSTLGAIYIDNRFAVGGFDDGDVELLSAFADQVAIALTRARLIDELAETASRLQRERTRVEQLLRERDAHIAALSSELEQRRGQPTPSQFGELVGRSASMRKLFAVLHRVATSDATILVRGESGTGKELAARAIHNASHRSSAPFVAINCGAMPAQLLESELFGHEQGAFTGADQARPGLFQAATGGTLFLDELGEMPLGMQVKLLRVLQERTVRPLGAAHPVPVDVRVVCATNRDLKAEVEAKRFRQDLYYRVAVVDVVVPPLRNRTEDIPMLAAALLARIATQLGRKAPTLARAALAKLMHQSWPGNVRELENVLTRAALLAENTIQAADLETAPLDDTPAPLDSETLLRTLNAAQWNASRAAKQLGIARSTLYRQIKRWGLKRPTGTD